MRVVGKVIEIWRYPFKSMAGERLEACDVAIDGLLGDRGWALRDERAGEIRGAKKLPRLLQCSARYLDPPRPGKIPHLEIQLPDGTRLATADLDAAERMSEFLGREVTLWPRRSAEARDHYRRGVPDNEDFEAEMRQVFGRLDDEPLPDLSVFPTELFEFTSPLGTYFDAFAIHLITTASLARLGELEPGTDFDRRRFRPNLLIETNEAASDFAENQWCKGRLRVGEVVLACEMPTVRCSMIAQSQDGLPRAPSVLRTVVREAGQNAGIYASVASDGRVAVGNEVVLE